ncbi:MAG TPA: Ldh family oxidoreductase [Stellaceae bacterium]|nr:Ldh family oxidoreductase [Stellaceae bacterium]
MPDAPRVAASELKRFVTAVFAAAGMAEADAATVAEVLVWANLRGNDGHGVQRIPRYLEIMDEGGLNPRPRMAVRLETAAALLIDADRAPGPVAMTFAADGAMGKAREAGIGLALVRRTTHTAAIGYYTRRVAEAGMAALMASASIPNMPYHGTRAAVVATNPLSLAVPGPAAPIVLDMATSVASLGRLAAFRRAGRALPPGWALDDAGNPTTDAARAVLPLPLGGPKGAGLALIFEIIASVMTGNPILAPAITEGGAAALHRQNAFIIAIDIARFGDAAAFGAGVGRLVAALKQQPRQSGFDEILMPGERGERAHAERLRDGIPLPAATWADLGRVAARFGLALPLSAPPP